MDGLDFNNILDDNQAALLFNGIPEKEELKEEPTEAPSEKKDNVAEDDSLFEENPESVGNGSSQEQEDTPPAEEGTSPEKIFSSIAESFAEEGIFPDLDEETIKNIKSAEDFRKAIDAQLQAERDEQQQRVLKALNANIAPSQIAQYEGILSQLDNITEDAIRDEEEAGSNLRKQILYQDYINSGLSEARAEKMVNRAFTDGTDVEDALDALESCKKFYQKSYDNLLKEAEQQEKKRVKEQEARAQRLKKSIMEDDIKFFGGMELNKKVRQAAYDAISKPVYKDKESGTVMTAVQKYEMEHSEEFWTNVGLLYALTDGFKSIDNIVGNKVKQGVKKGFAALDSKLKNMTDEGGTLKFMSGASLNDSPFAGKEIKLAF